MKRDFAVIEISYEVANKVGGIYTVLVSKSQKMLQNYSGYMAIGFYNAEQAGVRFETDKELSKKMQKIVSTVEQKYGFRVYCGKWLVKGQKPDCLLIDLASFRGKANEVKKELWENFGIDSLNSDEWFNEPVVWAKAAGLLVEEMLKENFFKRRTVVHCHEWLAGTALLHLKQKKADCGTVFTTHATTLGRSVAESDADLVEMIEEGLKQKKCAENEIVYKYNVQAKHLLEKACAEKAGVFTTVSEITAKEAEWVLCKKPDVLTPNGLDLAGFPLMEDLSDLHIKMRNQIRKFVLDYFIPYYDLDVKDTLFYFISGRQEFHNKGIDVFIEALGKLNRHLKARKETKTIVAFVFIPNGNVNRNIELIKNLSRFQRLEDLVDNELPEIKERIFTEISKGKMPDESCVLSEQFLFDLKKLLAKIRYTKDQNAPLSPFDMPYENEITIALKKNELLNGKNDKVKVIYYPDYLSSADGLLGMNYYDATIGSHLGIFPSYYEPWGYTPLETAAYGVMAITTDLAGFGQFIKKEMQKTQKKGIFVLEREGKTKSEIVDGLFKIMLEIYKTDKKERIDYKIGAKELSFSADWGTLIENYTKAYEMALKK
jgi:glycogen(starch) synthase